MREKELVIEPVIRWASIANVIVKVKVHSFQVSAQVSFPLSCSKEWTISPLTDHISVSAFRFTYNADTACDSEASCAKLSLLCKLVCFTDGEGINLFLQC